LYTCVQESTGDSPNNWSSIHIGDDADAPPSLLVAVVILMKQRLAGSLLL